MCGSVTIWPQMKKGCKVACNSIHIICTKAAKTGAEKAHRSFNNL